MNGTPYLHWNWWALCHMTCKSSSQLSVNDIAWQFQEPKSDIAAALGFFVKEVGALAEETVKIRQSGVRDGGVITRLCLYVNSIDCTQLLLRYQIQCDRCNSWIKYQTEQIAFKSHTSDLFKEVPLSEFWAQWRQFSLRSFVRRTPQSCQQVSGWHQIRWRPHAVLSLPIHLSLFILSFKAIYVNYWYGI